MFSSRSILTLVLSVGIACSRPRVDTQPPEPAGTQEAPKSPGGSPNAGEGPSAPPGPATPQESAPVAEDAPPEGEADPTAPTALRVIVPRGLAGVFEELATVYGAAQVTVIPADLFGILEELASRPADVVIPEGWAALEAACMAGVVRNDGAVTITHLPLSVTVAGARRDTLTNLASLSGARVGLADPRVSTSADAGRRVLSRAGVTGVKERILPAVTPSALQDGTVDAMLGWGNLGVGVALDVPVEVEELLPVPAAVTAVTEQSAAAEAFVTWLTTDAARAVLAKGSVPVVAPGRRRIATVLPVRLPEPRRSAGATVAAGRALLVGGEAGGELLDTLVWVEVPGYTVTTAAARLEAPAQGSVAAWLAAQRAVYVFGGRTKDGPVAAIQRYEPSSDTIQTLPVPLPLPLERCAAEVAADRVYLFGGATTGDALVDKVWVFEPATGGTQELSVKLPAPTADMAVAPGLGTTLRLFGGRTSAGVSAAIHAFDFRAATLETLAVRLEPGRAGARVLSNAEGWLVVGGESDLPGPPAGRMRTQLDLLGREDTWRRLDVELPAGVVDAALVELAGSAHVIGGLSRERVEARVLRLPE